MKCKVCQHEYGEGLSSCPRCGFMNIRITDDSPEAREGIDAMIREYRKNLLKDSSIKIRVYGYDQNRSFKEEKMIELINPERLEIGKIQWMEGLTCHREAGDLLTEIPVIITGREGTYERTMSFAPGEKAETFHIGILIDERLEASLILGGETEYSRSEPADLVPGGEPAPL